MQRLNHCFLVILNILLLLPYALCDSSSIEARQDDNIKTCIVTPSNGIDDAPAILQAFQDCGQNGKVEFLNETYHINSVMTTTNLKNVEIDLKGTLLWGTNISYWLNNSLPVGYQNQSTAWIFGGDNIKFYGHGYGSLNGSGQAWYTATGGVSNYPRRPHQITIINTTNSVFSGIRFLQSQMWTMTIIHSSDILLQDIFVENLTNSGGTSRNTDGANTIYANNITFDRWTVSNGDDSIAIKANSSNILVSNSVFNKGLGLAFGSIGQYKDAYEFIENVTARNIVCTQTLHAAYIKTWTGQQVGYPPNGGGGGFGYMKNLLLQNFTMKSGRGTPFAISQCTTFSGVAGDCNTSLFHISDVVVEHIVGTVSANPIASLQCSAASNCTDITIRDVGLALANGTAASGYNCNNAVDIHGFACTGSTCQTGSSTGSC
ncbi:exo-rhamnogalacturonase b [Phlyctema vagabunda]|uniref:Exo-rhamnogalacturonase b n=1 Tax=Phlyctema vagabunda TaxID=108571 RepID=A0ABR4P802_9HELO